MLVYEECDVEVDTEPEERDVEKEDDAEDAEEEDADDDPLYEVVEAEVVSEDSVVATRSTPLRPVDSLRTAEPCASSSSLPPLASPRL